MTKIAFEQLSQQAVVAAGVLYFVAFLVQLAGRRVKEPAEMAVVGAGVGAAVSESAQESVETRSEFLPRLGLTLLPMAALVHLGALVTRGLAADPIRVPWG
ncbi:MAG TPA: c-type cytochrome biogenesis protein CcsB, partial [Marmoricola sp.]|nr:c-type cytochrome biogenesis protein CcsB [Marmoricola sp.]